MRNLVCLAVVACVALGLFTVAGAQEEQRFQYRFDKKALEQMGIYIPSQSANVTTDPPEGVALPKFMGKPAFARWMTPRVEAGFLWLALDQSKKGGRHDRLYIDVDGDGRLAGETPVEASPSEGPELQAPVDFEHVQFGPVKVVFKGDDGPVTFHVNVRYDRYGESARLYLGSAG